MKKISLLISLLLTIVTLFSCNNDKYQFLKFNFDGYLNTECSITIEYNKKETSKSKVTKDRQMSKKTWVSILLMNYGSILFIYNSVCA